MDVNDLNKSQLIMLTLLVSFITSIATGVVTVSLMQDAPPTVAQTVNRVIERTVEKIAPSAQAASPVQATKTVIVNEADLLTEAVARADVSLVRLYASTTDGKEDQFLSLGAVLDRSGAIVSDAAGLGSSTNIIAVLNDGTRVRMSVATSDAVSGLVYLRAATSTSSESPTWHPATLAPKSPLLGQQVIVLSGRTTTRVTDSIVAAVPDASAAVPVFDTHVDGAAVTDGSLVVNTAGELVGMSTGAAREVSGAGFVPVILHQI